MSVVLKGAVSLNEVILEPFALVEYGIHWIVGETVIYADDGSIIIFDLEQRKLHKIVGNSYSSNEIVDIKRDRRVTVLKIRIDIEQDIRAGLNPSTPFPALARMYELSAIHPPTRDRIRQLFLL